MSNIFRLCDRCFHVFIPTPITPTATATSTSTSLYCPRCIHHAPSGQSLFIPLSIPFDSVQNHQDVVNLTNTTFSYQPRPSSATTSLINSLKNHRLDNPRVLKQLSTTSSSSCAICLEEFKLGDSVNRLPCRHWFHCDCVRTWLNSKNTCPLCRHELPREPDCVLQRRPPERLILTAPAITSTSDHIRLVRVRYLLRYRTQRDIARARRARLQNRSLAEDTPINYLHT